MHFPFQSRHTEAWKRSTPPLQSMNTVMDDNKMLTLASNERIPLTPSMRLLLEINHMNHCSPATVSRGGVIFVNAEDIGWKPVRQLYALRLQQHGPHEALEKHCVGVLWTQQPGSPSSPVVACWSEYAGQQPTSGC